MQNQYRSIGQNIERLGARERVRGAPIFSADIRLDSPLALKILRSGKAHAQIRSLNVEKALGIKGVVRVFTAADIPGENVMGIINRDHPLLATDKVRSATDPVALVAAETEAAAQAALNAIEVTYKELPAVFDPEAAMDGSAPKIHENGNILLTRTVCKGNIETAFEGCASIIEKVYRTSMIEHNYLEPDAGAGFVDEDGTLVIYASTQNPHYDHKEVVSLLGVEDHRVRIIQAATGGGFGSKLDLNVQGFLALALYHLKQPVRCVFSREEAYIATAKRHPLTIKMKTGAGTDGRVKAMQATIICDTGAYGSYGIAVASRAAVHATGPYDIEHVDIRSHCVYTNKPFCGAMRGFGTPQIAFAHESQMDLHAAALGLDPLEIRLRNAFSKGSVTATGQVLSASVGIGDCLRALKPHYAKAVTHWLNEKNDADKLKGIGVGAMWYGIGNTGTKNPSSARVEMDGEGRITLFTGAADIGQGSSTVLSQIAAETLGIAPETIQLVAADTGRTPNAGATSASRQTYISGNAVKTAVEKLVDALKSEASNVLGVAKSSLTVYAGEVKGTADPDLKISYGQLARRIGSRGESLVFEGRFDPETTPLDPQTGQGVPYTTYAFACQLALVVADALTGEVTVEKIVAAHDVGKAIHPQAVIGQICGGVAMGLGFALMEEFEPGKTLSMKDYHIPTCADMPEIIPVIVESPEPSGPFGAKGVGEPALIPTAPAILNGLANAFGQRIYTLPANLERVLETSIASGHFGQK
jgi:CO/xanthine dehydrogenase Mo-binding subunit